MKRFSFEKLLSAILLLVITFAFFTSCKKDTSSSSNPSIPLVKTYTEDITSGGIHSTTTYNLSYDANNRLVSMISASNPGDKFLYQYTTGNTYTLDIYNSNALSIHEVLYINTSSFLDSSFQYNDTKDSSTEKYYYNSSKQLIRLNEYTYSQKTGAVLWNTHNYSYDTDGNMSKDTDNSSTLAYTYYTNLSNTLLIGTVYQTQNKNLIKTSTYISGGITLTANYTYTFDSNNRLSTEKVIISNGDISIKTYTY